MQQLPSQDELRRILDYDPQTGIFLWRERPCAAAAKSIPGTLAGTLRAGYRDICISRTHYGAHRLAWKYVHGVDPTGEIDHINGKRTDNRIANLRDVTSSVNRRNAARPSHNTSGTVGVSYRADKRKWRAFISLDGATRHLGYFETWGDAVNARAKAEQEYGFHPNHGRAA